MKAQILTCLWNYKLDHRRPLSAGEMWPHVSGAASGLVGDQLSPQSPAQSPAINKPKWISNTPPPPVQFDLQDEPLNILGIQVSLLCLNLVICLSSPASDCRFEGKATNDPPPPSPSSRGLSVMNRSGQQTNQSGQIVCVCRTNGK